MIKGTYIFYEDGKEVLRQDNLITKFGKRFLTSYIAGIVPFGNKDIALGIASGSDYSLSASNSRLGFEFYRLPVRFGSIDIQPVNDGFSYGVIFKTTLPQDVSGVIKEIGLYPNKRTSTNNFDSKFITAFEDNLLWIDSANNYPEYVAKTDLIIPRIGDNYINWDFKYNGTLNTSLSTREFKINLENFNIAGYSGNDTITVAFNRVDTNSSKIRIKLYFSDVDYYYFDIDSFSGTGDQPIFEVPLSTVLSQYSNTPDSTNIIKMGIELTRTSTASNASIYFDGIRINDEDTFDPTFGLISRALISSPYLIKSSGRQVDIEYKLTLEF